MTVEEAMALAKTIRVGLPVDLSDKAVLALEAEVRRLRADLGGGEVASGHDIYRTGKYHGFLKNVYQNFPLGKACAWGWLNFRDKAAAIRAGKEG